MRTRNKWLLGGALALLAGAVFAQSTAVIQNLTGTEIIEASFGSSGPGGTGFNTTTAALRNGTSLTLFSGSGAQTFTAVYNSSTLYWVGTAPTSWTITTPTNPFDGEIITLASDTTLTSMVTLTANTGQSLNSSFTNQTITAKTSVEFQYSFSTTKWYELR